MSVHDYMAFMLRIWRVNAEGKCECRASLENPQTGSRYFFPDLGSLFSYLQDAAAENEDISEQVEVEIKKTVKKRK